MDGGKKCPGSPDRHREARAARAAAHPLPRLSKPRRRGPVSARRARGQSPHTHSLFCPPLPSLFSSLPSPLSLLCVLPNRFTARNAGGARERPGPRPCGSAPSARSRRTAPRSAPAWPPAPPPAIPVRAVPARAAGGGPHRRAGAPVVPGPAGRVVGGAGRRVEEDVTALRPSPA
jgi:hypothetical protein